jgi:uncharacterized protein (TIGR02757 family)
MKLSHAELHEFLEEKCALYNKSTFIESDPISIPHNFTKKEDIEIAGFLVATISWGQRITILKNGKHLLQLMGNQPYDFVMNFKKSKPAHLHLKSFVHRTFNAEDLVFFILSLQNIYKKKNGLEILFTNGMKAGASDLQESIVNFRKVFFEIPHPLRTLKHVSNPAENSAAKRINMYLRWMIRKDTSGVDFGLWKKIPSSMLSCPLDVHSGNVARKLGLLERSQNDWKATVELTNSLKKFDAGDPVKYDFALFGLGVFEKF